MSTAAAAPLEVEPEELAPGRAELAAEEPGGEREDGGGGTGAPPSPPERGGGRRPDRPPRWERFLSLAAILVVVLISTGMLQRLWREHR